MDYKVCRVCNESKPVTEYYKKKENKGGLLHLCKKCDNDIHVARYTNNPSFRAEKTAYSKKNNPVYYKAHKKTMNAKAVASVRKALYGITQEQYDEMLLNQNGVCKICGGVSKNGRALSVDHDHKTGKVRGLLCNNCNACLGHARDNVTVLAAAIKYLQKYESD